MVQCLENKVRQNQGVGIKASSSALGCISNNNVMLNAIMKDATVDENGETKPTSANFAEVDDHDDIFFGSLEVSANRIDTETAIQLDTNQGVVPVPVGRRNLKTPVVAPEVVPERVKTPTVEMADGAKYDKGMLKVAQKMMKDGILELGDAKKLWKSAMDGGKVDDIEAKTLQYIILKNNVAEDAKEYLLDKLGVEEVKGQWYDRDLLKVATEITKDGVIELGGAEELWKSAMDGKKVTEIEAKTIQYIVTEHQVAADARDFLLGKLGLDEINGQFYDKDLMKLARKSLKDGVIELGEAKKLWKSAMDGKNVSEVEAKTLRFIVTEHDVAEEAKNFIEMKLKSVFGT